MLKRDGVAVAFGDDCWGQCDIPTSPGGVVYEKVAAGKEHTALLKSDGIVAAYGDDFNGQCSIPASENGVVYTHVAAGVCYAVLLESDDAAVTCGKTRYPIYIPVLPGSATHAI